MYDSGTERRRSSGVKKAIDLYSVIEDILRHWLSILLLTAGVFICAFVFLSWRQQSSYASSATVAVTNANYTSNVDTYNMLSYMPDVTGKVKSILESKEFRDAVAADLGYSGFKGSETVSIVGDSNLIRITVRSGQPDVSYLEVKSILNNYKKLENNLSGGACFTVLEQPAIQAKPDLSASGAKKAALAALAVCALMCFALAGFSLCKDDIRDGFDVADKTGADFLGAIYRNGKFRTEPDVLITEPGAGQAYIEEIRRLATRISRKMTENGQKVLLVAGASGEEGKSAAAANLVAALRQAGKKVSLVSTTGAGATGAGSTSGGEQVTGAGGASGSGQATGAGGASGSGQVIGAQVTVADIASRIEKLREEADFVIIDAAPLSESSDAVELAGAADTSVLIVRRHYCDTPQIRSAVSALGGPEKLLGIIVTDVRRYCAAVSVSECARRREIGTRSFGQASGLDAGQAFEQASGQAFGQVSAPGAGQEPAQTYLVDRGDKNVIEIDLIPFLKDLMREVHRYCILLLAVMLLFGGVFYYFGGRKRSSGYTAYSTFTVEPAQAVIFPLTNQKNQAAALVGKMLPSMLSSDAMMSIVKEDLGYAQSERLPASISASVVTNTNLVKVSVSASDAQLAYDVLQSVLRRSTIITDAAIGTVQKTVVDESGVPERRGVSTGNGKKAAAAGLILGLIVGLAALVGKLVLRDTILTEDEISWKLKARSLGRIQWVSKKSPGKALTIEADDVPKNFAQSIRAVRCRVEEAAQTSGAKTFLVTSAIKSEGKTTAAVNLALALARNGHRVLLVDGDLRDPSAAKALGMEPGEAGLSDLLAGKCTAEQALVSYRGKKELKSLAGEAAQLGSGHAGLAGDAAQSGGGHAAQPDGELIVLPGGAAVESPYELWSGQAAGKLFEKLRGHFDYIIVDAPQSAVVSETGLIAELADACLFLIRRDCARFDEICEGAETFEESDCRFLGCVMRS